MLNNTLANFVPLISPICRSAAALTALALITALAAYAVLLKKRSARRMALADMRYVLELEYAHYKLLCDNEQAMSKARHDCGDLPAAASRHVRAGREDAAHELIRDARAKSGASAGGAFCGIPVINAVLADKSAKCSAAGIKLCVEIDIPEALPIRSLDLFCVISKLADNAIESCWLSGAEPLIYLASKTDGDYLFIKTENPSQPPRKTSAGSSCAAQLLSDIANKYSGEYSGRYENGKFNAFISLLPDAD